MSLQRQCVKREYCSSELYRKALLKLEGDASAAAGIVESLKADSFADDARYAAAFAREKASLTGWGPVKISFALKGKGISEADIRAALAEIDVEKARAKLLRDLEAKRKALAGEPYARLKLIKYALGKGYEYGEVESALNELAADG